MIVLRFVRGVRQFPAISQRIIERVFCHSGRGLIAVHAYVPSAQLVVVQRAAPTGVITLT